MEKINLARVEEKIISLTDKLEVFIKQNSIDHKGISAQIVDLAAHVNEQLALHSKRLDKIEDYQIAEKGKYKGLSIGLGIILSLLALIVYLKSLGVV